MATATAVVADPRVVAAWNVYLDAIRQTTNPTSYTEVESWAWSRLQQRLKRYDMEGR